MDKRQKKCFVIDTNVLLHNFNAIRSFGDHQVIIPIDVIEELDKFKKENTDLGRNSREVIRVLDRLRRRGRLADGVPLDGSNSGTVSVDMGAVDLFDVGLRRDSTDNRIISVAYRLQKEGREVFLVSKDMNQRIKAEALGLRAIDFEKEKVNIEELYAGWREVLVGAEEIREFFDTGKLELKEQLFANECVLLKDRQNEKHTALGRAAPGGRAVQRFRNEINKVAGVTPRNMEQRMALELLLDDEIRLVTIVGQAGTGKTLLALTAGFQRCVRDTLYEKLLVARPIMPLGRDIGYLPGTKEEKLEHWMQPIFDNLKFLIRGTSGDGREKLDELMAAGTLEMEALTYIRGRSIHGQFLIVDEAQNLTPHEIKTIISRAGHESKLVLTGDPYQIDNPYLDSNSNGLCYAVERLKSQPLHGHITLTKSERSRLASIAVELL